MIEPRILIAEDDRVFRMAIAIGLKKLGLSVTEARSGNEALDYFSREHFDLVLADITMPNGDGIFLLETIRNSGSSIPLVFLTAGEQISRKRAFELGASAFLEKPGGIELILKTIQALLAK